MRLPWADIFTTNWDTLLERAVDAYDRSYDTVVTVEQIASTSSPRIVKLHGCVRAGTPLIFTEEDFRTYPATYAPFVSLVQQSLMENVVVLFGFSGADPNFRAWHGWVRDHLGRHTQPLYMVALKPADAVDIHLMSRRLINPIDLSSKWQNVDADIMIENFLSEINRRLRGFRENLDWPSSRSAPAGDNILDGPAKDLSDWKRRIDVYPRWLVAPAQNRADLLASLDEAVLLAIEEPDPAIPAGKKALAALNEPQPNCNRANVDTFIDERVQAAGVVADSLRIALARPADPLFSLLSEILARVLLELLVPDENIQLSELSSRSMFKQLEDALRVFEDVPAGRSGGQVGSEGEAARAGKLSKAAEVAFGSNERALVRGVISKLIPLIEVVEREARLRGQGDVAKTLRGVLWLASGGDPVRELAVRSALACAFAELDLAAVEELLAFWPDQPHDAASNLRHAAIRREIGRFGEAEKEIESIVNRLRSLGSARRRDLAEASREAWAFYLYANLLEANQQVLRPIIERRHKNLTLNEVITELFERLDELETRGRDPRRDIDRLARDLDAATHQARLARLAGVPVSPLYRYLVADPATTFVVLSETVGLAVNLVHRGSRLALSVARLLSPRYHELAVGLVLRAGTPEDLPFARDVQSPRRRRMDSEGDGDWLVAEIVFEKERTAEDINNLGRILERLVAPASTVTKAAYDPVYLDRKVRLLQHLIAGLVTRTPGKGAAERAFELACTVAHSPVVSATGAGWSNLPLLFYRSMEQLIISCSDPISILMKLLELPIPGDVDELRARGWPDPFRLLVRIWDVEGGEKSSAEGPSQRRLRPLGTEFVRRASESLTTDGSRRSLFEEHRRTLDAIAAGCGPERRVLVTRRLEVLREVLAGLSHAPIRSMKRRPGRSRASVSRTARA